MPDSLVASQFADLEAPTADELALTLDATRPLDTIVEQALAWHGSVSFQHGHAVIRKDSAVLAVGA